MFFEQIKSNLSASVSARGKVRARGKLERRRSQHVLIIHGVYDEVAVLGVILRRRGMTTSGTCNLNTGLHRIRSESPDVIVLDENAVYHPSAGTELATVAAANGCQLIVLGKLLNAKGRSTTWIEITTPYHYDTLVRRIERTLRVRYAA